MDKKSPKGSQEAGLYSFKFENNTKWIRNRPGGPGGGIAYFLQENNTKSVSNCPGAPGGGIVPHNARPPEAKKPDKKFDVDSTSAGISLRNFRL